eukprot:353700-Chlamydomonas_euryale.AAC.6
MGTRMQELFELEWFQAASFHCTASLRRNDPLPFILNHSVAWYSLTHSRPNPSSMASALTLTASMLINLLLILD